MPNMEFRGAGLNRPLPILAAALSIACICGSWTAFAQGTLPLPVPGTTPAPAPGTPAAPGAPTGDTAARARAAAVAAKANIDITEAWARASGNATTAPIYFHIVSAKDADKLLGVDVAIAGKIELHDEMGRSVPIPVMDVPAGGTVNFAPGGRYLNLVGLKAPLKEGDSFLVTFKFDKAGTSSTAVKVLGSAATGPAATATARKGDTTSGVSQR
jgi:periplasmic copper chaperone A